ncbi:MAG: type III pantothenate kinase [Chloroflexi bacterium]|nr:type III pantothenate kinase [Chloroflexota bacterium]
MLLVADVGNSHTVFGLYNGRSLREQWRLATDTHRVADEWGVLLLGLLQSVEIDRSVVEHAVIASVVPEVTPELTFALRKHLRCDSRVIKTPDIPGITLNVDEPYAVGVDRMINVFAARQLVRGPAIVVDFGTATTFDVLSVRDEFLGGAIAPGIGIASEALYSHAALLPRIAIAAPPAAIGRTTVTNMQSGIVLGYAALVDGLVNRIMAELGERATVFATGGWSQVIAHLCQGVDRIEPALTLNGLATLWHILEHEVVENDR